MLLFLLIGVFAVSVYLLVAHLYAVHFEFTGDCWLLLFLVLASLSGLLTFIGWFVRNFKQISNSRKEQLREAYQLVPLNTVTSDPVSPVWRNPEVDHPLAYKQEIRHLHRSSNIYWDWLNVRNINLYSLQFSKSEYLCGCFLFFSRGMPTRLAKRARPTKKTVQRLYHAHNNGYDEGNRRTAIHHSCTFPLQAENQRRWRK